MLGMYDGHGGQEASCHVAENIGPVFKKQCALTPEAYAAQDLSVNKKWDSYKRDNPEGEQIPILEQDTYRS